VVEEASSGFPPGRIVLVLAIVVGCLGILWPRIFSPLFYGEAPAPAKTDDDAIFTKPNNPREGVKGGGPPHLGEGKGRKTPPLPVRTIDKEWKAGDGPMPGMRPTMGGPGMQPPQPKTSGTLGVLMPLYTIAIIVFFVYTAFKVMNKNKDKEEEEEEEVDEKQFADNIKYDEEYYNNYIKKYDKEGRPNDINHQKENTNLSSANNSNIEDILEEEEIEQSDSENESDGGDDSTENDNNDTENIKTEENFPKSPQTFVGAENKPEKAEETDKETKEVIEDKEKTPSTDPRDVEIQVLKARLEQTEAALERIVAHMGSVTARLARNGVFMDEQQHSCATHQQDRKDQKNCGNDDITN